LLISIHSRSFSRLSHFFTFVTVTNQQPITTTFKMRVSCFFVSVAIIFAQQASAAPIGGLPNMGLIGNESGIMHSLSTTLNPIPLIGPLTGDVLESKSQGDLLSTTEVAGNNGLINSGSRLGKVVNSIQRRENEALLSSLSPVTDSVNEMPVLSTLSPATHTLTSTVGQLDAKVPVLSGLTDNVSLGSINIFKRSGSIPFAGSIPGLDMLGGSSKSSSIPGLSALPSFGEIPGMSSIGGLASGLPAMPMGGFMKRDNTLETLPVVGSLPGMDQMTSLPGFSSLSSMPGLSSLSSMGSGTNMPGMSSVSNVLSPLLGGLL